MSKTLHIENPVDSNLKPVKDSDGTLTSLEISTEKIRVKDLEVTGNTIGISASDDTKLPLAGGTMTGNISVADGFTIDSAGSISLDSHNGNFIAKKAGTEFSQANSAYAGMVLGATRIANNGTGSLDNLINLTSTMTVLQTSQGTDVSIAFVAPPSGNVFIEFRCRLFTSSTTVAFALSDNATFNEIDETHTYDGGVYRMDETDTNTISIGWLVTGLTSGTSYTYYVGGEETSGSSATINHGRFRSTGTHYPPIIVTATAMPVSITTGE